MLRRTVIALLAALLIAVGLVSGATTTTGAVSSSAPSSHGRQAFDNSIGIVTVPTQRLLNGCRRYTMRWKFNPPTKDWTVLARMRAPKRFSIRSDFWDGDAEGKLSQRRGTKNFTLCRSSVKPGVFKIEMQMIYTRRDGVKITKHREPVYFRMLGRR